MSTRNSLRLAPHLRALTAGVLLTLPLLGIGQDEPVTLDEDAQLGVELNRLEQLDGSCRVYLVFQNKLGVDLDTLQLELVLFDSDGFVQRRLTLDAAPIPADKTSVKLFDLSDIQCDEMGRVLVNNLLELGSPDGALPSDVSKLDLSSKLDVDLFK